MDALDAVQKWQSYQKNRRFLYAYGFKNGLIKPYDIDLIETLRNYYCGALPISVVILSSMLCNGFCVERPLLLTFAFNDDDYQMVDALIDGIALDPSVKSDDPNIALHRFVQRTDQNGHTWVYDTSLGLVFAKDLYYQIENPKVVRTQSKKEIQASSEYQKILQTDIEKEKSILPLALPRLEPILKCDNHIYTDILEQELELFKICIDYDMLCAKATFAMINKDEDASPKIN